MEFETIYNNEQKNWHICHVYENGGRYYKNKEGFYHREDGPAIIYPSGKKMYYMYGYNVSDWLEERGINICDITDEDLLVLKTEMIMMKK